MAKRPSTPTLEVIARYNVCPPPNSAAPTSLPLTFFDIPWLFFSPTQTLFFYEYPYPTCHFLSTTLPTLTHSLQLALQHFFALAGTFVLPPDHSSAATPQISYDYDNYVSLVAAESNGDFFNLSGNHQRCVDNFYPLLPPLPSGFAAASKTKQEIPLLSIQITIFPNSGICIAFSCHHVAADARTFNNFIKTWASFSRDPCFLIKALPFYDRTVVKDTYGLQSTFLNHWSNKKSSLAIVSINNTTVNVFESEMVRATFLMSPAHMEKLKQWIIGRCNLTNKPLPPCLSPYNLASSFVWVCLIKAQGKVSGKLLFGKKPSYFGFNAGGITRLDYPIPTSYFGNCIGFARCMAIESELCGEDGMIFAANAIGNKIKELNEAMFKGSENWISDWEVFYGADIQSNHVLVMGSPKVDLYDTDFGWGRPNKIEEISIDNYANAISFTESRQVKGGIEIGLALPKAKMDAFTSFFTQGMKLMIK